MKILAIRLKNLASLAGPFELDFTAEPLVSAGLFAITGPTGAGKSTLLDALCLALFGAVPRLGNASQSAKVPDADGEIGSYDPRTLLRRGTGAGYAEVDFLGVDGRRYRARWEANRARDKPAGKLQNSRQSLRDLDNDQLLASQKGEYKQLLEARLGLNFEQFTRAVMLAQSEFSAFLKADDNERSELLEKLTDTALYTRLGKRAFEKSRDAREQLKHWQDQATGIAPLAAEAREALDLEFHTASEQLRQHQAHLKQVEQQQQWHCEDRRLSDDCQAARQQVQDASQAWEAGAEQRLQLHMLEQLAPQRHLFSRQHELQTQLQPLAERIEQARAQQVQQQVQREQLDVQREQTGHQLQQALAQQAEAQPLLQQAFDAQSNRGRLHTEIEPLRPALAEAERQLSAGQQALHVMEQQQAGSGERLQQVAEALERSAELAPLAGTWGAYLPRLQQVVTLSSRLRQGQAELPALQTQAHTTRTSLAEHESDLARVFQNAPCSAEQLPERVQQLTQRLQQQHQELRAVQELERLWQRRSAIEERLEQGRQQQASLLARREQLTAQGLEVRAAHEQAEQALKVTLQLLERQRLARSESVEQLRERLQPEQPCPVCGSVEHPYHAPEALLQALSAHDDDEEQRARAALKPVSERLVELRTEVGALIEQHKQLKAQEQQWLDQPGDAELARHPLYPALCDAEQPADWLCDTLAGHTRSIDEDERQQNSLLALQQQASALQRAVAQAREASQQAQQLLQAHQAHLDADQQRLDEELQALASQLPAARLQALREHPAQTFMALEQSIGERLAQIEQRDEEQGEFDARARRIEQARSEHARHQTDCEQQRQRVQALSAQLQTCEARLRELLGEHAQASAWQTALHDQVEMARDQERQTDRQQQDLRTRTVQTASALEADTAQQAQLQQTLADVEQALHAWREQRPQLEDDGLQALLAIDEPQVDELRSRLQSTEKALEQARIRLHEREQRQQSHRTQVDAIASVEALDAQHAALLMDVERQEHHCAELRARQAEDQRRHSANHALQTQIAEADAHYQRWARLAALIGSAEGDRFRKIAQAYNLDLLVHHANVQLRQLVRRYRLKRGGSMLGLLVLDTEMGDELRSVHSLSGGETFLVSLALALGLASMASSTLRIESLFIDEGFGSLDPESLQLAMDALDGLQAQGRKVAVISHVQEMHERIPVQIQVRRLGNGLSSVEVSG
ncbi:chromosome segregation protein SMC [Pseudomonas rhizosphaerae]|uniref:Nuclease SbcCD subunit C n=1 Tax=Pseudomonas rhizosphaerae TaxID=216142 RepID=A0A089YR51_9PSED|nr:AAA family ATPase [Pseudomonas rhizosphaerae]AIS16190.1 chromosome segregation protein SMC [Pseudomonas rhizosphaerae]